MQGENKQGLPLFTDSRLLLSAGTLIKPGFQKIAGSR